MVPSYAGVLYPTPSSATCRFAYSQICPYIVVLPYEVDVHADSHMSDPGLARRFLYLSQCLPPPVLTIAIFPTVLLEYVRQLLEDGCIYQRPTVIVFVDVLSVFDSIDEHALRHCLLRNSAH